MGPLDMGEGASPEESEDIERQLLEELREYTRGAMAGDMRERYGKPPLAAEGDALEAGPEEAPAEDADIPGVEAVPEGEGDAEAGLGAEGLDVGKLKAVLAKLKAG